MQTLIVHPDSKDKLTAVKAVLKALDIAFEEKKAAYSTEFEAKIREGEEDIKSGRTVKVSLDDLWK
jgi:translation initiation factor 2B subunit (eIF-2B alpha/beta/delta family)